MNYKVFKSKFLGCVGLTWESIEQQIEYEMKNNTCRIEGDGNDVTYLLLDQNNYCSEISNIHQNMRRQENLRTLHVYASKTSKAKTFGRHNDSVDVLIVQSFGKMSYKFDDGNVIILSPGDGVFIPKGMYHDPIPIEPRITLSFSWE